MSSPRRSTASLPRSSSAIGFRSYVELNALLYIGVVSIVAGLGWTFRDRVVNLGDAAILSVLGLLMAAAYGYCFTWARIHQRRNRVVVFGLRLRPLFRVPGAVGNAGFIETRFAVFHGWDTHLLIVALVFGGLAYRFDNRFVLSLALSTLAGYLGLKISGFDTLDSDRLRFAGFLYGGFLIGIGVLLHQRRIKAHFFEVYLQLGANALLLAAISGVLERDNGWAYLVVLLAFAATSIYLGVRLAIRVRGVRDAVWLCGRQRAAARRDGRAHPRADVLHRHRIDRRDSARRSGAKIWA